MEAPLAELGARLTTNRKGLTVKLLQNFQGTRIHLGEQNIDARSVSTDGGPV
jgi:hypothetical protein